MDRKQGLVFGAATVCALTLAVAATSVAGSGGGRSGGPVRFSADPGPLGDVLSALQFGGLPSPGPLEVLAFVPGLFVFSVVSVGTARYLDVRSVAGAVTALAAAGLATAVLFSTFPRAVPDAPFGDGGTDGLFEAAERSVEASEVVVQVTPLVGLVALVGAAIAFVVLTGDETEETTTEPIEARGPTEVESIGAAAGRAADELEDEESFENAVYRAWRGMTDAVAVESPETTTPGEFADRAVDAGMAAEDVRELTRLFETVRYGRTPVTDERRRRARAALRRIEETYAGDR